MQASLHSRFVFDLHDRRDESKSSSHAKLDSALLRLAYGCAV